jgi:hypothetical protein
MVVFLFLPSATAPECRHARDRGGDFRLSIRKMGFDSEGWPVLSDPDDGQ